MVRDFIYPVLGCALWVEYYRQRWGGDVCEVQACITELRFLQACFWWFFRYDNGAKRWGDLNSMLHAKDDNGDESWGQMKYMLYVIGRRWKKLEGVLISCNHSKRRRDFKTYHIPYGFYENFKYEFEARVSENKETKAREFKLYYVEEKEFLDVPLWEVDKAIEYWNLWSAEIDRIIDKCKLNIRGYSGNLLHCCTFKYRPAPSAYQMLDFLDTILQHLKFIDVEKPKFLDAVFLHFMVFLRCLNDEAVPLKKQVEPLEEKVMLLQAFFKLIPNCVLELKDFRTGLYDDINNDINKLVWLSFFFWAKPGDDDISSELNLLLFDVSRKITKPSISDFTSWYFGVLKVMRSEDALVLGQAVPGFPGESPS